MEELEKTGSRLEMTRLLAELYKKVTPYEGRLVAYLSQGRLGPAYNNPNFGVADKMMVRVLGPEAEKLFKQLGDLGMVAEKLKAQNPKSKSNSKIKIQKVYGLLKEIAGEGGAGSQEKKLELIKILLSDLGPLEAKYATKMILGKLRSGFSDMTVLDSLSWMVTGDKSLRKEIERVYNVRADLGEVVRLVKEAGSGEKIKKLEVEPVWGTPVLVARAERAKTIAEIWKRNGERVAEHKLDGLRIQAHVSKSQVKLFSRGLEDVTAMYPDIAEGLLKQVHTTCILDGEMIALDGRGRYLPFQETAQRKRKYGITEMIRNVPLKYFVFDLLMANGKSLLEEANSERWSRLEKIIGVGGIVKLIPRRVVKSEAEIGKFFEDSLREGTEGIMVKRAEGRYQSGSRDFNWIKYKKSYDASGMADTIDAVVLGYDAGEGKRSGFGIGGFLIGVKGDGSDKYLTIAKIGTGLKDDEWRELKRRCEEIKLLEKPDNYEVGKQMGCDVWVRPKIVVEIKADEITKSPMHTSKLALRFPRLVSFRDMKIEDATSMKEIERLYKLQKEGGD